MNNPVDTRLNYDNCSYNEKLKRTSGPGLYKLNTPYNDCDHCGSILPDDPYLRYQSYGPNTCSMKSSIDDSSELIGLNYKKSKCNDHEYVPGKYLPTGNCIVGNKGRQCFIPREDTRLSNPTGTLRGTGINRFEWLCHDPQEKALEEFDRVPVNYRMVAKDNHIPIIETPIEQSAFTPKQNFKDNIPDINSWKKGNAQHYYAPGYPLGSIKAL